MTSKNEDQVKGTFATMQDLKAYETLYHNEIYKPTRNNCKIEVSQVFKFFMHGSLIMCIHIVYRVYQTTQE